MSAAVGREWGGHTIFKISLVDLKDYTSGVYTSTVSTQIPVLN